ncbi:MAG: ABC transporter permease [Rikenellaceae bacterium]|nr:ABC transporter permease [Rikenellaceae bacterium]
MLKYLLEKEFKQFIRNPILPRLVFFMPVLMLLVMPWAADMTTKNVNLVVVDQDHTTYSNRLVEKATSSDYFIMAGNAGSYEEAMQQIEIGDADVILEIPHNFERDLKKSGISEVLISANTVNGTKGSLGSGYLSQITADFARELAAESGRTATVDIRTPQLDVIPNIRYNPTMDYKKFMVPAFMVMLATLICGFLPALNIVMEKEAGTIEQINVTPIPKTTFILAKLIPFWIMGLIVISLSLVIAWLVYGIVPAGSLLSVYVGFAIYVVALSGFGIVISNYSSTMQQAMFVMFFFMIIFILMSGLFTPVSSMPDWAQKLTLLNPLRYFIQIMRSIFFKASTIANLWTDYIALVAFALFSNIWAVVSYRKSS